MARGGTGALWTSTHAHQLWFLPGRVRVCGLELRQAHARLVRDRGPEAEGAGPDRGVYLGALGALGRTRSYWLSRGEGDPEVGVGRARFVCMLALHRRRARAAN